MPRRNGPAAEIAAYKRRHTQWRYLLRHPDFQKLINELLDTYDLLYEHMRRRHLLYEHWRQNHERWLAPTSNADAQATKPSREATGLRKQLFNLLPPELQTKVRSIEEKLTELQTKLPSIEEKLIELCKGVSFYPLPALRSGRAQFNLSVQLPKLSARTVSQYEELLDDADPVSVIEDGWGENFISSEELGNPHRMYVAVDLAYPRDVLGSLFEKRLSEVLEKRGKRTPGKRQRSDKTDFNISVYDLVMAAETFPTIARRLGRPVSSVKSAYLAACLNIFGSGPPRRKREMPLLNSFEDHFRTCEVCSRAERADDFCALARAFVDQGYRGRDELPVGREPSLRELPEEQ
jgi:hypothetical protein